MSVGRGKMILGPMYSEKTTELLREIQRARLGRLPGVIVKSAGGDRYGEAAGEIRTHGNVVARDSPATTELGRLRIVAAERLAQVELGADEMDIGIDEGQFYDDLPEVVAKWLSEGRRVTIAGLDGDFQRKPFGRILEALPLVSHVEKLAAVCGYCAEAGRPLTDAPYSVRISKGGPQKVVGGRAEYLAACPECYRTHAQ